MEAQQELNMHSESIRAENDRHWADLQQNTNVHQNKMSIEKEESRRSIINAEYQTRQMNKRHSLTMESLDLAHTRKMREEEFRMLSRNMNDKLLKIKTLDAVKDIY